eukprot:gene5736-6638_t
MDRLASVMNAGNDIYVNFAHNSGSTEQQQEEDKITTDLRVKHCLRLEELMRALHRYNTSKRKVIERFNQMTTDIDQYWSKSINLDTSDRKQVRLLSDFNNGYVATPALTTLHQWLQHILHVYKLELIIVGQ